jgi:hypothetical protein
MKKFLEDASIGKPLPTSRADLLELCATITWPRSYLAKKEDPEALATKIPDALFAKLRALYPIPPRRATSTFGDSIYARVAEVISLFAPNDINIDPTGAANVTGGPSQASGLIKTARPDVAATLSPPPAASSPSPSTPSSSGTGASASSTPLASAGTKRKLLMHDDLRAVLEDDVYHALHASAGLSAAELTRLHKACRDGSLGVLLDNTTSAAFGHQFILAFAEGSHFHTGKRGLALAIAGRSAAASSAVVDFMESMTRDAFLRTLRDHWVSMLPAFSGDHELSGTIVNRLWEGVTFTMKVRAARATAWGVPEVADACARQYQALPAYRVTIAATLARASSAYAGTAVARHINRAYFEFFLPFWWEHILLRGQLDADKVNAEVRALMLPPAFPAADPPVYPAAPLPPVPPPAPPPPPPAPPAAPTVPAASPAQQKPPLYVARPCSALIPRSWAPPRAPRTRPSLRVHHQRRLPRTPAPHFRVPAPLPPGPRPLPRLDARGLPHPVLLDGRRSHPCLPRRMARLRRHPRRLPRLPRRAGQLLTRPGRRAGCISKPTCSKFYLICLNKNVF